MRYASLLVAFAICALGSGCSRQPKIKPEDKPRMMRQMVLHSVRLAREQPGAVPRRSALFIERLQEVKSENLDDNGPLYDQLIQKYQELAEAAKRSPGSEEVNKKLGELDELGRKLPM